MGRHHDIQDIRPGTSQADPAPGDDGTDADTAAVDPRIAHARRRARQVELASSEPTTCPDGLPRGEARPGRRRRSWGSSGRHCR